jgi:hypothetical protein
MVLNFDPSASFLHWSPRWPAVWAPTTTPDRPPEPFRSLQILTNLRLMSIQVLFKANFMKLQESELLVLNGRAQLDYSVN